MTRRVAVALHEDELGGASRSVLSVVPLLEERGWRFSFWAPGPGGLHEALHRQGQPVSGEPRLLRYSWDSLRVAPGPWRRLAATPGYLRRFRAWVASKQPAILHANTLIAIPELLAAAGTGPSRLLYVHETLPEGSKGRAAAALAKAGADAVVGVSASTVAALERYGVHARLVYNGVRAPDPQPPRRDHAGRLVIGTLGTVSHRKGSDLFVAIAKRLRPVLPAAEFRMIGPLADGPQRSWAEAMSGQARSAGIRCGVASDVFAELAEWDMLVLPSRDEPFGLAVVEAMVAGVPVVATRVGGLPEIVAEDAGVLVEPDDADALASAVLALAGNPRRRRALAAAGQERATRRFSVERQAEEVHQVYLSLLEHPTP